MGSVHLQDLAPTPSDWLNTDLAAKWVDIRAARRVVTAALEVQRTAKTIGASLEAAPIVYVSDAAILGALKSVDFANLCITSGIILSDDSAPEGSFTMADVPNIKVEFALAKGEKCQRCWQILPDVGHHAHAGICGRCDAALD